MKYKFFAIPARNPATVEAELNAFCSSHRVGYIDKHLVADGADSFWSVCVSWLGGEEAPSSASTGNHNHKHRVDYKEVLSEADFGFYLDLHSFRKTLAEEHNVPSYALFTNDQLAAMVQQRIHTKAGLQTIEGVGKARLDKYGEVFLQKLEEMWAGEQENTADETGEDQA